MSSCRATNGKPCGAWREPLTAAGDPYHTAAKVNLFTLEAFRADGVRLSPLWAWTVRGPDRVMMARSDRRVPLVEAQLAAEDAARTILESALAVLGGTK